mgnify:CR=1 FL=1
MDELAVESPVNHANFDEFLDEDANNSQVEGVIQEDEEQSNAAMKKLFWVSLVCICFMVLEVIGGILSESLAILSDAAHLLSDFSGFALSMISLYISKRSVTDTLTYGYGRAEVIGALTSIILIWGLTAWLMYEAVMRVIYPEEVDGKIMFITACFGLGCNLIMMKVLHSDHSGHSHSHEHEEVIILVIIM